MGSSKKHKKHKKEKYEGEKPPALKLILRIDNSPTQEPNVSPGQHIQPSSFIVSAEDESCPSVSSSSRKSKKKKKRKERDRDRHERKKKHRHKDKIRYSYDEAIQANTSNIEDSSADVPLALRDTDAFVGRDSPSSQKPVLRESRMCVQLQREKQKRTPFQTFLDFVQQELEKKDVKRVFAWPVNDEIAPGYSQIITQPMDFSTMREKIDGNCYQNLNSYMNDVRLMCNNAMIYNRPDTMYYKAAKRLLHASLKFVSSDKLHQLAPRFPIMAQLTPDELGFQLAVNKIPLGAEMRTLEIPDDQDENLCPMDTSCTSLKDGSSTHGSKFEAIPDALSPEEILAIAQNAARTAAEKLALKRSKSNMGIIQLNPDGSSKFSTFVMGENGSQTAADEPPKTLGQLSGKVSHGLGHLRGPHDRKNVSSSVKPVNCGSTTTSYSPSYDSTFANLTKEETDLLYESYGDENAALYAESILNFAKDCDYTLSMVENLLDLLTGGEHHKVKLMIEEHRKYREEEERVKELMESKCKSFPETPKCDSSNLKVELDQLKSLSEYGIDTSFIHDLEKKPEPMDDLEEAVPSRPVIPIQSFRKPIPMDEEAELVPNDAIPMMPIDNPVDNGVVTLDDGDKEACGVGVDFESELREFLESNNALSGFPLHDDNGLEEMLS